MTVELPPFKVQVPPVGGVPTLGPTGADASGRSKQRSGQGSTAVHVCRGGRGWRCPFLGDVPGLRMWGLFGEKQGELGVRGSSPLPPSSRAHTDSGSGPTVWNDPLPELPAPPPQEGGLPELPLRARGKWTCRLQRQIAATRVSRSWGYGGGGPREASLSPAAPGRFRWMLCSDSLRAALSPLPPALRPECPWPCHLGPSL